MVEEVIKDAAGTISQTVLGAILILSWIIFGLVYRELKKEIKDERDAHQVTREARLEELKSNNHVATGLLAIQDEQKRQNSAVIDALQRRAV